MNLTRRAWGWLSGRASRARCCADLLDQAVNEQVGWLPAMPEEMRLRRADRLAELVMLAQDYRRFAQGRLSARELRRRGLAALARLESPPDRLMEQLTERE